MNLRFPVFDFGFDLPLRGNRKSKIENLKLLFLCLAALEGVMLLAAEPIKLHPDNPHYFLFRGRPTVLITSGEHYGAVLNQDFDYILYLNELQARGFNLTRTFSGTYREIPGRFKLSDNSLVALRAARAPGPVLSKLSPLMNKTFETKEQFSLELAKLLDEDELKRYQDSILDHTKTPGSFKIAGNPLAPAPNRYLCPWARSGTPGYGDGGNKFDLNKFDEEYFRRLKDFVAEAAKRGVVVEYVLFCPNYDESLWQASPMNARNNVNGVGAIGLKEPYTLAHKDLQAVQDAFVRRAVTELNGFDNVYYEICNEPYFGGVTLDWQAHIAAAILEAESKLPHKHLIAQNIANGSAKIGQPDSRVSIFNFHYARPPDAVGVNYLLNKAIAFDESGFRGSNDRPYRTEAWDFILAGGAVYDNLDYSYTPHKEDGTAVPDAPGGGGPALRSQLRILKDFIHGLDFVKMAPAPAVVKGGLPPGASARVLAEAGRAYALFIHHSEPPKGEAPAANFDLALELPAAQGYVAEWLSTLTGEVLKREEFKHAGGAKTLASPPDAGETALRILGR